jgi:hypothetical protein
MASTLMFRSRGGPCIRTLLKVLVKISGRNGLLRTGADRFGPTGDDSGQKRTILDN